MSANPFKFPPPPPPPPPAHSTSPTLDRQRAGQRKFASRGQKGPTRVVSSRSSSRVDKRPHRNLSGRQPHGEWSSPPSLARKQPSGPNFYPTSTQEHSRVLKASTSHMHGVRYSAREQEQAEDLGLSRQGERDGNILGLTPLSSDLVKSNRLASGASGTEEASLSFPPVEPDEDASVLDIPLAFKGRSLDLKSPEDVRQWLEERRRRFPKNSNNPRESSTKANHNLGTTTTAPRANVADNVGEVNARDAMTQQTALEERLSSDGDSSEESTDYTSSSGLSSENEELPEQIPSKLGPTPRKRRSETTCEAPSKTLCRTFARKGSCAYGQKCKFKHSGDAKTSTPRVLSNTRPTPGMSKPARKFRLYEKLVRKEQDAEDRKIVAAIISLGQKGLLTEPG